jgi:hypothetical protein
VHKSLREEAESGKKIIIIIIIIIWPELGVRELSHFIVFLRNLSLAEELRMRILLGARLYRGQYRN